MNSTTNRARINPSPSLMNQMESYWSAFFPKEQFSPMDQKIKAIEMFHNFFLSENGKGMFPNEWGKESQSLILPLNAFQEALQFYDFIDTLRIKPVEIIGCVGLALSLLHANAYPIDMRLALPNQPHQRMIIPRFVGLLPETNFAEIRASAVNQLVSLTGQVVRVDRVRSLVTAAYFWCSKCEAEMLVPFEDGIFIPPAGCNTKKCTNKYLDLQRANVQTIDMQKIKLQETEICVDSSSRVPRTVEIEVIGDLVNTSCTGDIVKVVGIIKTMQSAAPRFAVRGVARESAVHQLYMAVNSMVTVKRSYADARKQTMTAPNDSSVAIVPPAASPHDPFCTDSGTAEHSEGPESMTSSSFSASELASIRSIGATSGCVGLLVASLCPQIFGHHLVKLGLLLSLFGGTLRDQEGIHIRSDIHCLIVGDPGMGKSQMLRAASLVAPRSVFVSGASVTTAGLTVSTNRDAGRSGDAAIEAGALVLADSGLCCIDELDKIDCDHHALLEAMEQQSVSIAKAGVMATLKCRTSLVAAANPAGGHYNRMKEINENLQIPVALLSRFDMVFILVDRPDTRHDMKVSEHIFRGHQSAPQPTSSRSDTVFSAFSSSAQSSMSQSQSFDDWSLSQKIRHLADKFESGQLVHVNLLRSYIEYARTVVQPQLTRAAAKVLQRFYLMMRAESSLGCSIPVTTRHLESLIRLSQARARLELRAEVTRTDAEDVVKLMQESLLDAFSNSNGVIAPLGLSRNGSAPSGTKQMKALVQALTSEAQKRNTSMFTKQVIHEICQMLKLQKDTSSLIEAMRTECYLLLKGPGLYQLNVI